MGKRLILVLALALIVGLTFSAAYAEVQNVKVSGDIIASAVARSHFNLVNGPEGDKGDIQQNFFMTQTRLRIDADLTDNVSATVRLINERIWNGQYDDGDDVHNNSNINLDLAYVTLKEFLYSPLTLTIGRQEIAFGNSLIIGNAKVLASSISIPNDLTKRKAFDAIRATLNYDPLVVDLVYAKIKQPVLNRNNTIELLGFNANYALNKKVDLSAYYFLKSDNNADNSDATDNGSKRKADKVNTIGALVSARPIDNLVTSLEAAYQFGKNDSPEYDPSHYDASRHNAWALQGMADYTFAKMKMTPKIGLSYTYLSGDGNSAKKRNMGWDPMFYDQKLNNITYAILPFSNLSVFNLKGSIKPTEDVTVLLNYGYYDRGSRSADHYEITDTYEIEYTGKAHLGDAIDATVLYDYTEDVQIGLTAGWFKSGRGLMLDAHSDGQGGRRDATQLIGSMKVVF